MSVGDISQNETPGPLLLRFSRRTTFAAEIEHCPSVCRYGTDLSQHIRTSCIARTYYFEAGRNVT